MCHSLPEGQQSGEQFVRDHFLECYTKYACSHENILLVIVQDIDKEDKTPNDAKNALNSILQNNDLSGISSTDKLLLIFPKRNIETWFEWIQQEPRNTVSEVVNYKNKHKQSKPTLIGRKASKLYSDSRNDHSVCNSAPNSLAFTCEEFTNLCETIKDT